MVQRGQACCVKPTKAMGARQLGIQQTALAPYRTSDVCPPNPRPGNVSTGHDRVRMPPDV